MKNIFFNILFFFTLIVNSQELLLHYSFDGNSNDISGNTRNGNSSGVVYVDDKDGNANSAAYFDGLLNSYDPKRGWDGSSNGVQMLSNDYWSLIEGIELSCSTIKKKGHFSLIRN